MGLQEKHLGCEVTELVDYFETLHKKFGFNIAGEGGEYETLIIDSPIFKKKLIVSEFEKVVTGNSAYSPYGHLIIKKLLLEDKTTNEVEEFAYAKQNYPKVFIRQGELFIEEIDGGVLEKEFENFEYESFCVLKALKESLEQNLMELTNVYYITVYIKDMNDYATFNSVYSKFFNFPNPPSRICIEMADQQHRVKISAKATVSKKKSTHVQSISS